MEKEYSKTNDTLMKVVDVKGESGYTLNMLNELLALRLKWKDTGCDFDIDSEIAETQALIDQAKKLGIVTAEAAQANQEETVTQ